jgi:hypothetical protein
MISYLEKTITSGKQEAALRQKIFVDGGRGNAYNSEGYAESHAGGFEARYAAWPAAEGGKEFCTR